MVGYVRYVVVFVVWLCGVFFDGGGVVLGYD